MIKCACNRIRVVESETFGVRNERTNFVPDNTCIGYKDCTFYNMQFKDDDNGIHLVSFVNCMFVDCGLDKSGISGELVLRNCTLINCDIEIYLGKK